jgi:hypothetical protein
MKVIMFIAIVSACVYYNIKVDVDIKFDKNNPHFQKSVSDLQEGLEKLKK